MRKSIGREDGFHSDFEENVFRVKKLKSAFNSFLIKI